MTTTKAKDRAAAVQWLAANPDVWSDRPRDDPKAEEEWCLRVLRRLVTVEGFYLGEAGGLNDLLGEARAAMVSEARAAAEGAPTVVRLEAEDGSGAVQIGGEPSGKTVKSYKVG